MGPVMNTRQLICLRFLGCKIQGVIFAQLEWDLKRKSLLDLDKALLDKLYGLFICVRMAILYHLLRCGQTGILLS